MSRTTPVTDKTIYILDPDTNTLIPYKPDYNAGVPFTTTESISIAQSKKAPRGPKQNKEPLGVIVPLIKQRPNQSDYVQLATIAQKYPRVNTIAVISPSNDERGIGDIGGPDQEYVNAIRFLQANGVQVVGYMHPELGTNGSAEVNRWREWYPDINGLYLDLDDPDLVFGGLASYAKVDKGFQLVIADMTNSTNGGVVNTTRDYVADNKAVDIFVVYEREGYPVEGWYPSIRKDWMSQHPRSRFAFIPYRVPEDTLACRNFVDKVVGIEKLAGYVYVHAAHETDRRKMKEWTNISSLLEVTLDQLDRMAVQEGIPSTKGVVPDTMKPTTLEEKTIGTGLDMRTDESVTLAPSPEEGLAASDMDKFGVRKIYPNSKDKASKEWYVFMDNPRTDSRLQGLPDKLEKQADGSWSATDKKEGDAITLAAKLPEKDEDGYLNVEVTGYFKVVQLPKKSRSVIEMVMSRGGLRIEPSGYIAQLLKDGAVSFVKLAAQNPTGNRGTTQATNNDILNRWIGMKFIVYNSMEYDRKTKNEQVAVQMEIWVDDNVNDENGNLVVKNDWKQIANIQDGGGWFFSKNEQKKGKKKATNKKDDTILISPGSHVAWSWSNSAVINWKFLSVREIDVIHRD